MEEQVLQVKNISKKYMLLSNQESNDTFAGVLKNSIKGVFSKKNQLSNGKEFWALRDVKFTVNKGDRIGIIGHNGAGKSTLLKIFSRITIPTDGEIEVKGRIASLLEVGTGFHQELTGRENIYLNGSILGMTKEEIEAKFNDIVQFSEIGDFLDTPVKKYSSGMYVKLAFAVAAHLDPDILIVDEVLAVGDMKFQEKCLGKMEDISGGGRTVLYVSHNMRTVQQLCNRVIVLDHGKVVFDGGVDDGIRIYMDNLGKMNTYNDYADVKRSPNESRKIEFLSSEVVDKTDCFFEEGDKIKLNINCIANNDAENARIRIEIAFGDKSMAGTAFSNSIGKVRKGEKFMLKSELDISSLAPGKYQSAFLVYESNEYGSYTVIDRVFPGLNFEILPTCNEDNLVWSHTWWGHTKLPNLKIYREEI